MEEIILKWRALKLQGPLYMHCMPKNGKMKMKVSVIQRSGLTLRYMYSGPYGSRSVHLSIPSILRPAIQQHNCYIVYTNTPPFKTNVVLAERVVFIKMQGPL